MMTAPDRAASALVTRDDTPAAGAVQQSRSVLIYDHEGRVVLVAPQPSVLHPDEARSLADRLYEQADALASPPSARVVPFPARATSPAGSRAGSGT